MRSPKNNSLTSADSASAVDNKDPATPVVESIPLTQYIQGHKLPGNAANDPHKLALEDFLFEHMQQRANAQPEATDEP